MKRFLPIAGVVLALTIVGVVTAVALGGSDDSGESARQDDKAGDSPVAAMCAEDVPDCNDMIVDGAGSTCLEGATDCVDTGGSMNMCIAEDNPGADDAAPECNDIVDGSTRCAADASPDCQMMDQPPPNGPATAYDLRIVFNDTVTQAHIDETAAVLTDVAPDTEFLVQESFPPVGVAHVRTDMASFCSDIEAKFESFSYVSDVVCSLAGNDPVQSDLDEPVSSDPADAPDYGGTD